EKWDAAGRAATLKSASPAARTGSEAAEPATAQAVSTDKPAIVASSLFLGGLARLLGVVAGAPTPLRRYAHR
ncbi:hypothetical protein, partial [Nocardia cyriacigeorgica]|uniref:hypothetical protein n=1 Tax=Nocardia cyriacigeorgica TaxID=135487 RepID=UPI002454140D